MLVNAAWLTLITYGLAFIVFLLMLAPAGVVVAIFQNGWSAAGLVFAILFAWAVKQAVIEPFAICCMMQAYFKAIEGQSPDPEWDARLSTASNKFRELAEKAGSYTGFWRPGERPAGTAGPAA
jgi:ABC-type dipeptide/oligopeptide/nickel transport system permease component